MTTEQIASLQPALAGFLEDFRRFFKRQTSFQHWQRYLLGLMADLKRKSVEPIALAAGVAVRTLQEFLAFFQWDDQKVDDHLQRRVADEHGSEEALGVLDASGHAKQGAETPGVQRQWCGELGKKENCVVGQHLLYTDRDPDNPFCSLLASDLYLPRSWDEDRDRCRKARIPEEVVYRPKWRIGIDQLARALGNGLRFSWITFDEDYGDVPEFWFALDRLGQRAIGEVRSDFTCWPKWPACHSLRKEFAAKQVRDVYRHSPAFGNQEWRRMKIADRTRGPAMWEVKAARVHLVDGRGAPPRPTERKYWLIVARNLKTQEVKYFVSNAGAKVRVEEMLTAAFARWHVEKWFERAKQEAGFGSFEVRTYRSLIRHWLCCRMVMYFLAAQTERLRGEKSGDYVGASGGGGQRPGHRNLAPILALAGGGQPAQLLPSATHRRFV